MADDIAPPPVVRPYQTAMVEVRLFPVPGERGHDVLLPGVPREGDTIRYVAGGYCMHTVTRVVWDADEGTVEVMAFS